MFLKPFFTKTVIASPLGRLTYHKGKIEAHLTLDDSQQEQFERRLESLKLAHWTAMKTAEDEYLKQLWLLFVEFGSIAKDAPIELTQVVSRNDLAGATA